ncbi:hypothetical protein OQA88_11033 [Cercophora sp. LCS_1]
MGLTRLALALALANIFTPCLTTRLEKRDCPIPKWSVESVSATYSDDTYVPGQVLFTVTNTLTNATETLNCPIQFNTVCTMDGTPGDPALQVYLQVNIDFAWVTFNKTWSCETDHQADPTRPRFVYGYGEFDLHCPEEVTETMTCTGLGGGPLLIETSIFTPEPEVEFEDEE